MATIVRTHTQNTRGRHEALGPLARPEPKWLRKSSWRATLLSCIIHESPVFHWQLFFRSSLVWFPRFHKKGAPARSTIDVVGRRLRGLRSRRIDCHDEGACAAGAGGAALSASWAAALRALVLQLVVPVLLEGLR